MDSGYRNIVSANYLDIHGRYFPALQDLKYIGRRVAHVAYHLHVLDDDGFHDILP